MKVSLPIDRYEVSIVNAIKKNDFLIVVGQTGCGKTTRIPQFLANDFSQVIVTEPRILTAKTASYRVAEEMNVTVGVEVGYKTGYDKCFSSDSKILFCTDGLQLVRSITLADGTKENVLVIDEIHLWNQNMESLVAWCKFMRYQWKTKVVIMSATMDAQKLKDYLGGKTEIISVPGRLYPVAVEHRGAHMLIPTIIEYVEEGRDTLVFVSGKKKMEEVMSDLQKEGCNAVILPLHGELEWEDQKKCYDNYGKPKVIVATNIAQDGVTIPGVSVVDTGKAKVSNAESGVEGVVEVEISKADSKQREGRAGRTEGGRYTLCSDYPYECRDDYDIPEIQRSILDRIVLQLASAGLDAEKLEFYHQPDMNAIKLAKSKLIALGATDANNNVTKLGSKMVKMPVSVELARMIVAAEEYGVTEQVMTIAAILQMGGIFNKRRKDSYVSYSDFSGESTSDWLAELDVWENLNKMGYINFKEIGINRKNFNRIKEHIKKLRIALEDLVDIQHNDDRDAILNACLTGMVTNIYVYDGYGNFIGEDGIERQLDNSSCVRDTYAMPLKCVVGKPKMIPWKSGWRSGHKQLITFATKISKEKVEELVPSKIRVEVENTYDSEEDAVIVTTSRYYLTMRISSEEKIDHDHPDYDRLKAEYEEEQARYERLHRSYSTYGTGYTRPYYEERQRMIQIDGRNFEVSYHMSTPIIAVDNETLFKSDVKKVTLDNGRQVMLTHYATGSRLEESMAGLRNAVENARLIRNRNLKKSAYARIQVCTLQDVLANSINIGAVELIKKNGGYSDESIYAYGCLTLKKKTVSFDLIDDEEKATDNTREAMQYLFMKEVERRYPISSFSAQKGKKKKVLTHEEMEMKMEFDSLVRELLCDLTVSNAEENLEFLEEYFQEMNEKVQKAS